MEKEVGRRQTQRDHIIDATWRVVSSGGFEALTMRELASELGLAHGAVKYYFPSKDALLEAALERVTARSSHRVKELIQGAHGIVAMRRFVLEIIPLTDDGRIAARVVVASWGRALGSYAYRKLMSNNNLGWRKLLQSAAEEAAASSELAISAPSPVEIAGLLATLMSGSQPLSILLPEEADAEHLGSMIDAFLDSIASTIGRSALDVERANPVQIG